MAASTLIYQNSFNGVSGSNTFGPGVTSYGNVTYSSSGGQPAVYLDGYATMGELLLGLSKYFVEYNGDRPHQALGNKTPDEVYQSASGGGAMIVDKYGAKEGDSQLRFAPAGLRSEKTVLNRQ